MGMTVHASGLHPMILCSAVPAEEPMEGESYLCWHTKHISIRVGLIVFSIGGRSQCQKLISRYVISPRAYLFQESRKGSKLFLQILCQRAVAMRMVSLLYCTDVIFPDRRHEPCLDIAVFCGE